MAIYNKTELANLAAQRLPPGIIAGSSVQDILDQFADMNDSADLYAGVMTGSADTLSLTTSLSDVVTFDTIVTSDNDLFAVDIANNRIQVKEPLLLSAEVIFQGEWAANIDMTVEMWVIDSVHPTGIKHFAWVDITQSGSGAGRTVDMFKKRRLPMIAAAYDFTNPVYVYFRAKTSLATTVTQFHIQLGTIYEAYTVRGIE